LTPRYSETIERAALGAGAGSLLLLRYIGYLLVAIMALALLAGGVVILIGGLGSRVAVPGTVRLIAFDDLAPVGGRGGAPRVLMQDLDYGAPCGACLLVARFADGWAEPFWTNDKGFGIGRRRLNLPEGPTVFTVSLPATNPRLDIEAHGSIWLLPREARMLWVDTAAVVSQAAEAPDGPPLVAREALEALKHLAVERQVVYLVTAKAEQYPAVRHRLGAAFAPPGPVLWLGGDQAVQLALLRRMWPNVEAVLVCQPALAEAADKARVSHRRVPPAAPQPLESSAGVDTWSDVVKRLTFQPGGGTGWGDVK